MSSMLPPVQAYPVLPGGQRNNPTWTCLPETQETSWWRPQPSRRENETTWHGPCNKGPARMGHLEHSRLYRLKHICPPSYPSSTCWDPCDSTPGGRDCVQKAKQKSHCWGNHTPWLLRDDPVSYGCSRIYINHPSFHLEVHGLDIEVCGHLLCGGVSVDEESQGLGVLLCRACTTYSWRWMEDTPQPRWLLVPETNVVEPADTWGAGFLCSESHQAKAKVSANPKL